MRSIVVSSIALVAFAAAGSVQGARAADNYTVDPVHTCVYFKIQHLGISSIFGRFNAVKGTFTLDKDEPRNSSFTVTIPIKSVDTNNKDRDKHLLSPTFFNEKQFPLLKFQSTSVKAAKGGYKVVGKLTLHGVTKPITFTLQGGKEVSFQGVKHIGFTTELTLKRTDFGMTKMLPALGDRVTIAIGLEGTKGKGK
jgi:polyisoprenoid-binding protein YceI